MDLPYKIQNHHLNFSQNSHLAKYPKILFAKFLFNRKSDSFDWRNVNVPDGRFEIRWWHVVQDFGDAREFDDLAKLEVVPDGLVEFKNLRVDDSINGKAIDVNLNVVFDDEGSYGDDRMSLGADTIRTEFELERIEIVSVRCGVHFELRNAVHDDETDVTLNKKTIINCNLIIRKIQKLYARI